MLLAAVALSSHCVAARVAQLRADLLETSATELRSCMGAPSHIEIGEEGAERWAYLLPFPGRAGDLQISVPTGRGVPPLPPRVVGGEAVHDDETVKDPGVRSRRLERAPRATCVLVFQVKEGRVTAFDVRGRDRENLNSDAVCALQARRCSRDR